MVVVLPKQETGSVSEFATLVILDFSPGTEYGIDFSDVCQVLGFFRFFKCVFMFLFLL